MLTARDELSHLADTLTEAQAERVLAAVRAALPELYPSEVPEIPEDTNPNPTL